MEHFLCIALVIILMCFTMRMGYETYGQAQRTKKIPKPRTPGKRQTDKGFEGNIVTFWGVDPNQLQIAGSGKQY